MSYFAYNSKIKLQKSILKKTGNILILKKDKKLIHVKNEKLILLFNNIKKILHKKLTKFFFLRVIRRLKKKKTNRRFFSLLLKFYKYLNFFFFNKKKIFKKYFSEKFNILYLKNFFLQDKTYVKGLAIDRLKKKRLTFYKKKVWKRVRRKIRKKNLLIFNKKFFRAFAFSRYTDFLIDYFSFYLPKKPVKNFGFFKKSLYKILRKRYHYLFLRRKYVFNKLKKQKKKKFQKYKKRNFFNFIFKKRTFLPNYYLKKFQFFEKKSWFRHRSIKNWRPFSLSRKTVLLWRKRRIPFWTRVYKFKWKGFRLMQILLTTNYNFLDYLKKKKKGTYTRNIILDYLDDYSKKLAKKHYYIKNFRRKFYSKKKLKRLIKNIIYFIRWKPKFFFLQAFNFLDKSLNFKKKFNKLLYFRLLSKKIRWKKKKYLRYFFVFFFKRFLFKKIVTVVDSKILKFNFFFRNRRRLRKLFKLKKKKNSYYNFKKKKRSVKRRIVKKYIRIFFILIFLSLSNRATIDQKTNVFKNALIFKKLQVFKNRFTFFLTSKFDDFYFKKNHLKSINFYKKNIKIFSLLKKI